MIKIKPMTRREALTIINSMPYLVCLSETKLLSEQIPLKYRARNPRPETYDIRFEVSNGSSVYAFRSQPFRVLRVISKEEFQRVAPWACMRGVHGKAFFYHIATD